MNSLYRPFIATVLTYSYGFLFVNRFLLFMAENFNDECRKRQKYPFKRKPPPSDSEPPNTSVMLVFYRDLIDDLDADIIASTFRACYAGAGR